MTDENGAAAGFGRAAILITAIYIGAQMLSDVASLKIGVVAGLAVDLGTFIYPITFTLRDLAHRTLGKRGAQTLVLAAGGINLFMAGYLALCAAWPPDAGWPLNAEFAAVLGPVWRIVLASIAAEVVSELLDTEVYHWFVTRVTRRRPWQRVLVSNTLSIPADNLIFSVGAFGWALPWPVVGQIFVVNLLVKFAVTLLSLPLIYLAPEKRG